MQYFGELMITSGLVLMDNVRWISFHGGYDFGYLLKLLTCTALPAREVSRGVLTRNLIKRNQSIASFIFESARIHTHITHTPFFDAWIGLVVWLVFVG